MPVLTVATACCDSPEPVRSEGTANKIVNPLAPGAKQMKGGGTVKMGAQYTLPPGYKGGIPK